jgi:hypothetical protein
MVQVLGTARRNVLRGMICGALVGATCFVAAQDQFSAPRVNSPAAFNSPGGYNNVNPGYNNVNYNSSSGGYNNNSLPPGRSVPGLSESTAVLESSVRTLYKHIEPGDDPSPNELIAYADLRALRLYTGALEVAGWDLEQSQQAYQDLDSARYRGRIRDLPTDPRTQQARERFLAFRETVRTLLYRVRSTAVAVEHQVSFCDPRVGREWLSEVQPALFDVIASTQPLFMEQDTFSAYAAPAGRVRPVINPNLPNGVPPEAADVARSPVYRPYNGEGRGQGRYLEIRAFGGPVRVKRIRYVSHENNFGVIGTSVTRELAVDQIASPQEPLFVPCNRERFVDLSNLEVEWENADIRRNAFAVIDVVADRPNGRD